jgi:hypothetical protein
MPVGPMAATKMIDLFAGADFGAQGAAARVAARRLASLVDPCVVFAVALKEPARA